MAMAIVIAAGCAGAWMLVWGMCLMFASITNTEWDIARGDFVKWLRSPKFLKGLGVFLSSFLLFGLMLLLAVSLLT